MAKGAARHRPPEHGRARYQVGLLAGRRMNPERYEMLIAHDELAPGEESMAYLAESEGPERSSWGTWCSRSVGATTLEPSRG